MNIFIFMVLSSTSLLASPAVEVDEHWTVTDVFPFDYFADANHQKDFNSIRDPQIEWQAAPKASLNLGYTHTSYWLRFRVAKRTPTPDHGILEISYPLHDRFEIFVPDHEGNYHRTLTGDNYLFAQRPIKSTQFTFELNLADINEQPIYINIQSSSSMRLGMKLYSTASFIESTQSETAIFFMFYGLMGSMILYNFLLYISIGEKSYIYYVFYILSHSLFQMAINGHLLHYVLPGYPQLVANLIPTLVSTASIGVSLFTRSFLETPKYTPKADNALTVCIVAGVIVIVLTPFLPYARIIPLANLLPVYFSIVCLMTGILRWRQGYRPARIYVGAFTVFFLGVVLGSALRFGFGHNNVFTEYGAQIGASLEVIMLSIALASKINGERKSRYEAQKKSLALALEKQHANEQMSKVFYPHQINQIQKGLPIEQTMPTGLGTACVLSFDVISSSKIDNEAFSELIEDFIAECREIMMQGYDSQNLRSTAYMIKEMGDGFLCSVGFPFMQLGSSKAECAVNLAKQIIDIFSKINSKLDDPTPVYCCVGIAMGQVKSYFSRSGSIKYDLWGRAIVLATRYESLRKEIIGKLKLEPCNILVIQEDVYSSLPSALRRGFQVHSLQDLDIQIRDHPDATHLVFMQIPIELPSTQLESWGQKHG